MGCGVGDPPNANKLKGSLPVANVLDVLWDGGVGADPMPIHQGDQFALLNNNDPKFTVGKSGTLPKEAKSNYNSSQFTKFLTPDFKGQ
jgi:hypothetical protein